MHRFLVRNKRLILTLPLVLAASLLLPSPVVPAAHGQLTGLVCITDSTSATSCPASPPVIGPLTIGSTFSVGVFVQNSDPLGGWDIYVAADPLVLSPASAALGTLITSPTLTSICVNGVAKTGSCTVGTVNGPGVVEVTAIESSGLNDCNTPSGPCSGMAFTIAYSVVGPAPTTPIFYPSATTCSPSTVTGTDVCVFIGDNVGNPVPETVQGVTITQVVDPTTTSVACTPSSIILGSSTSCMATVTDTATTGANNPTGTVTFTTDGSGSFSPSAICNLLAVGANQAQCSVSYTPAGRGTQNISAIYNGDFHHSPSTAPLFPLTVIFSPSDFSLTAASTSLSIPSGGIGSATFTVTGFGGFTGSVAFTSSSIPYGVTVMFVPNPATITSVGGTATSEMTVFVNSIVAAGTGFTFTATGVGGPNGTLTHSVTVNVTVTAVAVPTLVQGKIHWTHHLSLSRTVNIESWTVFVADPLPNSVNVVVRIMGSSAINPSLFFDVACGVTCVNTGNDGVSFTPGLTPLAVPAGAKSFSFSFSQSISGNFVNQKVSFTATLYWAIGSLYTSSSSRSGAFAVVP